MGTGAPTGRRRPTTRPTAGSPAAEAGLLRTVGGPVGGAAAGRWARWQTVGVDGDRDRLRPDQPDGCRAPQLPSRLQPTATAARNQPATDRRRPGRAAGPTDNRPTAARARGGRRRISRSARPVDARRLGGPPAPEPRSPQAGRRRRWRGGAAARVGAAAGEAGEVPPPPSRSSPSRTRKAGVRWLTTYRDYNRDRIGWFFGLSGWQLAVLAAGCAAGVRVRCSAARGRRRCCSALGVGCWSLVVTVVPVRGRSATGWFLAVARVRGRRPDRLDPVAQPSAADRARRTTWPRRTCPGCCRRWRSTTGRRTGRRMTRVAIIQNHAAGTWAVTAPVTHPGIGMADGRRAGPAGRRAGRAARSGGPDRADRRGAVPGPHRPRRRRRTGPVDRPAPPRTGAPALSRQVNDDLRQSLTAASVRTEAFVTVVVPEARIGREARESGGGLDGRARVLYGLMAEVEAQLRGGIGMTQVDLADLAAAGVGLPDRLRPGRPGRHRRRPRRPRDQDPAGERRCAVGAWPGRPAPTRPCGTTATTPGTRSPPPSSCPPRGAVMGALAPVLTPGEPGERRSFLVALPDPAPVGRGPADREQRVGRRPRRRAARTRPRSSSGPAAAHETAKARGVDAKLARGNALTRPYAVVHRHRPQDRPDRRVRPPAGRVHPPGRVRAAAAGPGPRRRVRRLHRPARRQPHPPQPTHDRPAPVTARQVAGGVPGGEWRGCWPTSATTCPPPSRTEPAGAGAAAVPTTPPPRGAAARAGGGRRRRRRCRRGG